MSGDRDAGSAGDTSATAAEETPKATRRRGAELEQAILQAAAEELAQVGYQNLTMDGVAARAGTAKNAIYRRWPNRAALCVAAYRRLLPTGPRTSPTPVISVQMRSPCSPAPTVDCHRPRGRSCGSCWPTSRPTPNEYANYANSSATQVSGSG